MVPRADLKTVRPDDDLALLFDRMTRDDLNQLPALGEQVAEQRAALEQPPPALGDAVRRLLELHHVPRAHGVVDEAAHQDAGQVQEALPDRVVLDDRCQQPFPDLLVGGDEHRVPALATATLRTERSFRSAGSALDRCQAAASPVPTRGAAAKAPAAAPLPPSRYVQGFGAQTVPSPMKVPPPAVHCASVWSGVQVVPLQQAPVATAQGFGEHTVRFPW
jgi:hypothetical protein